MKQQQKKRADLEETGEYDNFPVSYEPVKAGTYNIYLFGLIESAQQFTGCVEVMRHCTDADTVVIHLQSCGGSVDAVDTLLTAMKECEGHVIVRATGGCHSAATLVLLQADTFTLSENFYSLIHNGSLGNGGKYSDYKSKALFDMKYFEKVLTSAYAGFLTPAEIQDVLKGADMWLDGEEWVARHEARNEYLKQLQQDYKNSVAKPVTKNKKTKKTVPND